MGSVAPGDCDAARTALDENATYVALNDESATCTNAEQIVGLMCSWKGKVPDVAVVEWETIGSSVLARLRQPAWVDAPWFQVLRVEGGPIRRLEDHPTRESALTTMDGTEA